MRGFWWLGGSLVTFVFLLALAFPRPPHQPALLWAAMGSLACLPIAFYTRNQCYKSAWRRFIVTPRGYTRGNALLLAALMLTLLVALLALRAGHGLALLPLSLALCAYLASYPRPDPMRPHPPRLARGR